MTASDLTADRASPTWENFLSSLATHATNLQHGCLLIRSRKQHPASTRKSSRAGPDFRVRVQGCAWSSVAVDVGNDVGQEVLRSRALAGCVPGRQISDAWSGDSRSMYSDQASTRGGVS